MNKERLLNVAKALRESKNPADFTMTTYAQCGTPACALGHYAARPDLQDTFKLIGDREGLYLKNVTHPSCGSSNCYCGSAVCAHFDITPEQATELFASGADEITPVGCGNPANAIEAAEYIERFVAERCGR